VAALSSPDLGSLNSVVDALCLLALFPLGVVAISKLKAPKFDTFFSILGSASYPLYVLHFPLSRLAATALHHKETQYAPFSGIVFASVLVVLCYLLERYIDTPLRKWLSAKLKQKKTQQPALKPLKASQ
jgi:peptidoglycan/LPS O-acetylase OafA/YrhL